MPAEKMSVRRSMLCPWICSGELGVARRVDHEIGRLDVAVDDARLVREVERVEQLQHEAEDRRQVERVLGVEVVLELLALDVLHHDVRELAFGAEVVHLHDMGMVEPRHGAHFALEAHGIVARGRLVDRARQDGLDRDPAVEARVQSVVDQSHGAFPEHPLDLVAAERCELFHRRMMILGGERIAP
jgi:hypothetical protein